MRAIPQYVYLEWRRVLPYPIGQSTGQDGEEDASQEIADYEEIHVLYKTKGWAFGCFTRCGAKDGLVGLTTKSGRRAVGAAGFFFGGGEDLVFRVPMNSFLCGKGMNLPPPGHETMTLHTRHIMHARWWSAGRRCHGKWHCLRIFGIFVSSGSDETHSALYRITIIISTPFIFVISTIRHWPTVSYSSRVISAH